MKYAIEVMEPVSKSRAKRALKHFSHFQDVLASTRIPLSPNIIYLQWQPSRSIPRSPVSDWAWPTDENWK